PPDSRPDVVVTPLIIGLSSIGAKPGDKITLTAGGAMSYSCYPGFPGSCVYQAPKLCALFTTSATNPVSGALSPNFSEVRPCVTNPTLFGGLPTDIPQDFVVAGSPTTIPSNAAYIVVAVPDSFYADNAGSPTVSVGDNSGDCPTWSSDIG